MPTALILPEGPARQPRPRPEAQPSLVTESPRPPVCHPRPIHFRERQLWRGAAGPWRVRRASARLPAAQGAAEDRRGRCAARGPYRLGGRVQRTAATRARRAHGRIPLPRRLRSRNLSGRCDRSPEQACAFHKARGPGWYHTAMKVVICGATGRTGRLLVEGALARGHDVTAFVRASNKLGALRDRVRVVHGDVLDGGAVSDAVDGQEAVLVALAGGGTKAAEQVNAQGTLNVIRSMQRYGVRRLVVLSAGGTQPGRDPNRPWFFERIVKPLFLKDVLADLRRMEISVRQSELD